MATQPIPAKLTFDQYLVIEEAAPVKSEYRGGELFAMSGGTESHARLASRMIHLLQSRNAQQCRVYTDALKLYVPVVDEAMYPDVMVICGEPEFYQERKDVVLNPTILVEVLSPSTENYDRGLKAQFYRQIPSLQALVLINSQRPYIQMQKPVDGRGRWILEEISDPLASIAFEQWEFGIAEIYGDILAG